MLRVIELARNGALLMFIKAVSVAYERGPVAFQRMMRKDVGEAEGRGEDMGWSFSGHSIAIAGSQVTAGRLTTGVTILDSKAHRERAEFKPYWQAAKGSRYNEPPSGSAKEDPCG